MKALTVRQPWATLIALGHKHVETRITPIPKGYRGPLAIHAGTTLPPYWHPFKAPAFLEVLDPLVGLNAYGIPKIDLLPQGAVVAIVNLVGMMPAADFAADPELCSPAERTFGDFRSHRWAWLLGDPVILLDPPVPASGSRHLWEWTPPPPADPPEELPEGTDPIAIARGELGSA